ncbi:MAG: amidohydrolase family protein, partial [Anaerovoracaceae bacterium]
MLFKNISILDEDLQRKENQYVGIKGTQIAYIGTEKPKEDFGKEYEGKGKLLMSGFVNAHAHSPMTLLRGYGENLALQQWLNEKIFPFEAKLDEEKVYWGTLLAMAESLRYGIVSTSDMYYFCDAMVKAVIESGAKTNLSRAIANFSEENLMDIPSGKEAEALYQAYHQGEDGRIKIDMALHAEYTSTPKIVEQL